jgi:hypothetical protein
MPGRQSGSARDNCNAISLVVIARREATKQSILSLQGTMDCFAALAMTVEHAFAFSRREPPESCMNSSPFKKRAHGNAGRQCTRSLVCAWVVEDAHEYSQRSHRNHPASPHAMVYGYFALSSEIGLSCLRRRRSKPRQLDASVEAPGPHDLAVRFSAARQEHIHVHRISSRVRDDRDTPLMWDETDADMPVIWVERERKYFLLWG